MSGVTPPTGTDRARLKRNYLALCIIATTVLTAGCAGAKDLTRSRAAELIRDSRDFSLPVSVTLPGKREWPTEARAVDEPEEEAKQRAIDSYAKTNEQVAAFRHLGLINFRATLIEAPSPTHKWWRFELEPILTAKGEQEATKSSVNKALREIAIARRKLGEVTGISRLNVGTTQVEFTWQQIPTSAGEALNTGSETYRSFPEWLRQMIAKSPRASGRSGAREYDEIHKGRALLQLYDDGWRVQHVQF